MAPSHERRASGLVLAAALLASVTAWALWRVSRPGPARPAGPLKVSDTGRVDVSPAFSPDGRRLAWSSDRSGRYQIVTLVLDEPTAAPVTVTSDMSDNVEPSFSPDGARIVYCARRTGGLWIVPSTGGGTPRQLTTFGSRPRWSPDGRWVAFQSEPMVDPSGTAPPALPPSMLWLADAETGALQQLTKTGGPPGGHGSPAWSPDGKRLVFAAADSQSSTIWILGREDGRLTRVDSDVPFIYEPVFDADGRSILFSGANRNYQYSIWRVGVPGEGDGTHEVLPLNGSVRCLALSPDGRRMAYHVISTISDLWMVPMSPATFEAVGVPRPLTADSVNDTLPVFSPRGDRIAWAKWLPGINPGDIWIAGAGGEAPRQLTKEQSLESAPGWLADGRVGFLSHGRSVPSVFAMNVVTGVGERLIDLPQDVDRAYVSPDGSEVAYHSRRGGPTLNIWIAPLHQPGAPPRQVTMDAEMAGFPSWSPDGRWLAVEIKRAGMDHVAIVSREGGPLVQLTNVPGRSWPHGWSPDGDKIAFAAMRDGLWSVRWVSRTTREERRITADVPRNAHVRYPAWSPRGDRLVYSVAETTSSIWTAPLTRAGE